MQTFSHFITVQRTETWYSHLVSCFQLNWKNHLWLKVKAGSDGCNLWLLHSWNLHSHSFNSHLITICLIFNLSPNKLYVPWSVLMFGQSCFPAGNREEAADLQQIALELRDIADQLEHNMVARATQNLSRNISAAPSDVSLLWAQEMLMLWWPLSVTDRMKPFSWYMNQSYREKRKNLLCTWYPDFVTCRCLFWFFFR